jgi:hypothetical protein
VEVEAAKGVPVPPAYTQSCPAVIWYGTPFAASTSTSLSIKEALYTRMETAVCICPSRVGILKQNAKSRYSGIPGFEVRQNSKNFFGTTI